MIGRETVYVAERVENESTPDRVRIVKDVDGPHPDLYPEDSELVAEVSLEQAGGLRDSLAEVLEEGSDR